MKKLLFITLIIALICTTVYALQQPLYQYYGQTATNSVQGPSGGDGLLLEAGDYLLLETLDYLLLE